MATETDIGIQHRDVDVRISALERRAAVLEEQKLALLAEERLMGRLAVLDERLKNEIERAGDQNIEVRRRLDELNHAHDKQVQDQAMYIERRVFDQFAKDEGQWREQTRTRLDILQGQAGGRNSSGDLLFRVIPLLISIGGIIYVAIVTSIKGTP